MEVDRRTASTILLTLLGSGPGFAQRSTKSARVGILDSRPESRSLVSFRQGMRENGYVEGQNLAYESRWTNGVIADMPKLAEELCRLPLDVIFAPTTPAAIAVQAATRTIPIVFAVPADPVGSKLVASLARPGANLTGLSTLNIEVVPKRLEILNEIAGGQARNGALLLDPADSSNELARKATEEPARRLGMTLRPYHVRGLADFDAAFADMVTSHIDALMIAAGTLMLTHAKRLVELAAQVRIPAMYGSSEFVEAGGLVSYSADFADNYRRAAGYVDKILKGAAPRDLPVEQVSKLELAINLKTASQLGLTVPRSMLIRATRVIE